MLTRRGWAIGLLTAFIVTMMISWGITGNIDTAHISEMTEGVIELQDQSIVSGDLSLLNFSSFLGGSGDEEYICSDNDAAGNIYIAGTTTSRDYPLVNPLDDTIEGHSPDGFLTKINPNGTIVYSTFIGGAGYDEVRDIFVDDAGFVYLTGGTDSEDFPIVNAYDNTLSAGDCFICKINQAGTGFVYSTFLGGSSGEGGRAIDVNQYGEAYVAGETSSSNFPTRSPVDHTFDGYQECFVSKLSSSGSSLLFSTLLGGWEYEECSGISVDAEGAIYVSGTTWSYDFPIFNAMDFTFEGQYDGFVTKINPSYTLNFSTFLGGVDVEFTEGIDTDSLGRAYVTGITTSSNFPILRALKSSYSYARDSVDGFLTVFNPDGSLYYSTFFGTSGAEWANDVFVNDVDSVYVCGSSNMLGGMIKDSYDSSFNGGADAFVFRMNVESCSVVIGSYLGGILLDEATSISVDSRNTMYVCGWTWSENFPMMNPVDSTYNPGGYNGYDIFVSAIMDSSDWDTDGIWDQEEMLLGTDFKNPDSDFDLLGDYLEVYQLGTNPLSNCTFGNGTLDGDLDHDGDLLTNVEELYQYGTDLLLADSDLDQLGDGFEVFTVGSSPTEFDSDFDLLSDFEEYMIYHTNCTSPDTDSDLMLDYYEVHNGLNPLVDDGQGDEDGDTLTNLWEATLGSSANNTDSDFDLMPDIWEYTYGLNLIVNDADGDLDHDTLSNYEEYVLGTFPDDIDSDKDTMRDDWEVQYELDPLDPSDANGDSDADTLTNQEEFVLGSNPLLADSDFDSMPDSWEADNELNPAYDDSLMDNDGDTLNNLDEFLNGCDPQNSDCDHDTLSDGFEVLVLGTNPLNSDSDMDSLPDNWEHMYGLNPLVDDSALDPDGDTLSNIQEYLAGTRPDMVDTDSDSYSDDWEVRNGFDPNDANLSVLQVLYGNLPTVILAGALPITALALVFILGQKKQEKETKDYQDLIELEMGELLDSIEDSMSEED